MIMKLSVVVPAYNEEECILSTLRKIFQYLQQKGMEYEVIVVDDGSTDNTKKLVMSVDNARLRLLENQTNLGKGAAVKKGMLKAQGDLLLFLDADYSTSINELDRFLPKIEEGYDIVIGSRGLKTSKIEVSQSKMKVLKGRLGNQLIQLLAVSGIKDTQCGFKLFTKKCLPIFKKQTLNKWGFDFELLFIARKLNLKIFEHPISWANNPFSKVKTIDYFVTLLDLIKIRINDIKKIYDKN